MGTGGLELGKSLFQSSQTSHQGTLIFRQILFKLLEISNRSNARFETAFETAFKTGGRQTIIFKSEKEPIG